MLYGRSPMLQAFFLVAQTRDTSSAQDEELQRQVSAHIMPSRSILLPGNIGDPL